ADLDAAPRVGAEEVAPVFTQPAAEARGVGDAEGLLVTVRKPAGAEGGARGAGPDDQPRVGRPRDQESRSRALAPIREGVADVVHLRHERAVAVGGTGTL